MPRPSRGRRSAGEAGSPPLAGAGGARAESAFHGRSMEEALQRKLTQLVLLPVLFFAGAKLSIALAGLPSLLVMLWIPNSLLLAALLHYGMRGYHFFAAAIL